HAAHSEIYTLSLHDALPISVQDIIRVLSSNADKAKALVARLAKEFPREHEPCPIGSDRALDTALITAPEARDPELLKKLDAVARSEEHTSELQSPCNLVCRL